MNARLICRTLFLIVVLLLLVLMGMNNRSTVSLVLPPLISRTVSAPAAIMYFTFFAVGVLTGTTISAGRSGKSGGGSGGKGGK